MKKTFFIIATFAFSFIVGVFISQNSIVNAQNQLPIEAEKGIVPIPGATCGDANNPFIQQCCVDPVQPSIDEELDKIVPDFGCLPVIHACLTDIPKKFGETIGNIGFVKDLVHLEKDNGVNPCINGTPSSTDQENCICEKSVPSSKVLCDKYLKGTREYSGCVACSRGGVWTGMGCIRTDLNQFIVQNVMTTGVGFAGVISLFCIIYSAYLLQFSGGNPERIKKARESLTACLTGLLIVIFAVFILQVIGVNILHIPGFS